MWKRLSLLLAVAVSGALGALGQTIEGSAARLVADPPKSCEACSDWNTPREAFRVHGTTWYVGVEGLSVVAIGTKEGVILLDGALPQSAPLVAENLTRAGFDVAEIALIGTSHEHFDHVGGVAALQRASGARVLASPAAAAVLQSAVPSVDDPQAGFGIETMRFPVVPQVHVVADGETIVLGGVALTAHHTPGHTPGSVTWTWRSCEGEVCLDVVYADSLNPVSAPGFRYSGGDGAPDRTAVFRASIAKVAALPCDILLAVHPSFADTFERLAARDAVEPGASDPFVDSDACRAYAADATARLERRLAEEGQVSK